MREFLQLVGEFRSMALAMLKADLHCYVWSPKPCGCEQQERLAALTGERR